MFHKSIFIGLLMLAVDARALTLDNALAEARQHNPELAAARHRIEAAAGRVDQARRWPNPELELAVEDMPADHFGLGRSQNMIGLSQTVPFPGKKSLDARIARQEQTALAHEYAAREREILRDIKLAFYRALAADRKVDVTVKLVDLSQSLVEAAHKRVAAGATGVQESLRAEIELERAQLDLASARRDQAANLQELARLLGRPDRLPMSVTGQLHESPPAPLLPQTVHPRLAGAQAERARAELDWQRARLDPWPDVTFGLAAGRETAANETVVELRVSLPLPVFDRSQGKKREAGALRAMAESDLASLAQRLLAERNLARSKLETAVQEVAAYRERILPKTEEALRLVRGGFAAGKFGFLDLLDVQRTDAEAQLSYLDKLLELNLAIVELEALAGNHINPISEEKLDENANHE